VLSIFSENNELVLGDYKEFFFDLVLQMGANGASGQELHIAAGNRFHTNFLRNYGLITSYFHPIFIAILHKLY
jgi:hypothetical protein